MNYIFSYVKNILLKPNERKIVNFNLFADANFIVERLKAVYGGSFKIQILDTTASYNWFNEPMLAENLFGTSEYPHELSFPIELRKSTQLRIEIEDLSGVANDIELTFEGYQVFQNIALSKKRFFTYPLDFTVPALDIIILTLQVNNDTNFLLKKLYHWQNENYSCQISMAFTNLSGRNIASNFINIDNMFGSVLKPNNLKHPLKILKNSIITIEIKNITDAVQNGQIVFDGVKLWEE